MFNSRGSNHNESNDPRGPYKSTPKKYSTNVDNNNNSFEKLNEKLNDFMQKSIETNFKFESKILEIDAQLQITNQQNMALKTELDRSQAQISDLGRKLDSLYTIETKFEQLALDNNGLSKDLNNLKSFINNESYTKDEEFIKCIKISIDSVRQSLETKINKLNKDIVASYDKKSKHLNRIIHKISNVEFSDKHGNSSQEFDNDVGTDSDNDNDSSESSSNQSTHSMNKPDLHDKQQQIKPTFLSNKEQLKSNSDNVSSLMGNINICDKTSSVANSLSAKNSSLFGSIQTKEIVDSQKDGKASLFGDSKIQEKSSLFGNELNKEKSSLFGNSQTGALFGMSKNEEKSGLFSISQNKEKSSLFGNLPTKEVSNNQKDGKPSLFGNSKTEEKMGLFGNVQNKEKPSLFGSLQNKEVSDSQKDRQPSLFGNSKTEEKTGLFGNVQNKEKQSLFGNVQTDGKSCLFGNSKNEEKPSLFGGNKIGEKTSLFGNIQVEGKSGLFGNSSQNDGKSSLFGNSRNEEKTKPSLFGNSQSGESKPTLFSSLNSSKAENPLINEASTIKLVEKESKDSPSKSNIFAGSSFNFPGNIKGDQQNSQSIFGNNPNIQTFSSFAAGNKEKLFGSTSETSWQAGPKMFSNIPAKEEGDCVKAEDSVEINEHDPEFKPLIDLPPLIEIVRDDDQKDVLFKNRCKLYRFINNEWKERGVGDMKVLRCVKDGVVTMVMRREQVHKICCNQRVTKDSHKLAPMGTDKSACWSGADFSDGESEMVKFAVKFGDKSIMDEFSRVIAEVQSNL